MIWVFSRFFIFWKVLTLQIFLLKYLFVDRCEQCLEILISTNRLPEAAFFARTYLPSQISRYVSIFLVYCSLKNIGICYQD